LPVGITRGRGLATNFFVGSALDIKNLDTQSATYELKHFLSFLIFKRTIS